jgi:hypothetical protein
MCMVCEVWRGVLPHEARNAAAAARSSKRVGILRLSFNERQRTAALPLRHKLHVCTRRHRDAVAS